MRRAIGRVRVVEVAQERLEAGRREQGGRLLGKRRGNLPLPRLHEHANAEPLRLDGIGRGGGIFLKRHQVVGSAEACDQDTFAVEHQLHLMPFVHASGGIQVRAVQPYLEVVFTIDGKCVPRGHAAKRAQREALEVLVLRQVLADRVRVAANADAGIADRDRADLPRGGEIRLQQRRRTAKRVGHVVESIRGIIRRKEQRDVDVESQQIPDRVRVLGPVEPVQHGPSGIRMRVRGGIELFLEPVDGVVIRRAIGTTGAERWHRAHSQLPHDFLPRFSVVGYVRQVEALDRQPARPEALTVTGNAVVAQRRFRARRRRGRGGARPDRGDQDARNGQGGNTRADAAHAAGIVQFLRVHSAALDWPAHLISATLRA